MCSSYSASAPPTPRLLLLLRVCSAYSAYSASAPPTPPTPHAYSAYSPRLLCRLRLLSACSAYLIRAVKVPLLLQQEPLQNRSCRSRQRRSHFSLHKIDTSLGSSLSTSLHASPRSARCTFCNASRTQSIAHTGHRSSQSGHIGRMCCDICRKNITWDDGTFLPLCE